MLISVPAASLAVAALAAAAPAQAALSISADRPCYSAFTPLSISGAGFTPGGALQISETWLAAGGWSHPGAVLPTTADAGGAFTYSQQLPAIDVDQLQLAVTVTDRTRVAQAAPPAEQSASMTVTVSFTGAFFPPWSTNGPARGRPGHSGLLSARGYIGSNSRVLYVHYIRHGRLVKTLRVGRLSGPCGTLTKLFREFGFRPVPPGTYSPQFDTTRAWPNDDMWSNYRRVVVGKLPPDPPAARRRGLPARTAAAKPMMLATTKGSR